MEQEEEEVEEEEEQEEEEKEEERSPLRICKTCTTLHRFAPVTARLDLSWNSLLRYGGRS